MLDKVSEGDGDKKSSDPIDVAVGAKIRSIMVQKRTSYESMAANLGISWQQLRKNILGDNRISIGRLVRIAAFLEVDVATLLNDCTQMVGKIPDFSNPFNAVSAKGYELAMTHDAIVDPSQRTALRNLARTMAQADD